MQVLELAVLKELTFLSLPLSMAECISNLPEVIYVLKEFHSLRYQKKQCRDTVDPVHYLVLWAVL
jgi:hypothetical protein